MIVFERSFQSTFYSKSRKWTSNTCDLAKHMLWISVPISLATLAARYSTGSHKMTLNSDSNCKLVRNSESAAQQKPKCGNVSM